MFIFWQIFISVPLFWTPLHLFLLHYCYLEASFGSRGTPETNGHVYGSVCIWRVCAHNQSPTPIPHLAMIVWCWLANPWICPNIHRFWKMRHTSFVSSVFPLLQSPLVRFLCLLGSQVTIARMEVSRVLAIPMLSRGLLYLGWRILSRRSSIVL